MSLIISRQDKIIGAPTVYVPLEGKQVKRVEKYKVGEQCEVKLVGVIRGKDVNSTEGGGLSGSVAIDVYRLELTPIDGTFSDLTDEEDDD